MRNQKETIKKEQKELKKNKSDLEMKNTVLKVTKITQKIQWQNSSSRIEYKNEDSFWIEIGSNYSEGHFISWTQNIIHYLIKRVFTFQPQSLRLSQGAGKIS